MKTEELRYLKAFAECQNIKDAAKRCHINRSTMSRCIARFEKEMNAQLFVYTPFGLKQTDRGKQALKIIDQILSIQDQLTLELSQDTNLPDNLRLAIDDSLDLSLIEHSLNNLKEKKPYITLSLSQKPISKLINDFNNQKVDAIFTDFLNKKDDHLFIPVSEDPIVMVTSANISKEEIYAPLELSTALKDIPFTKITDNAKTAQMLGFFYDAKVLIYKTQLSEISKKRVIIIQNNLAPRILGWIINNNHSSSIKKIIQEVL